MSDRPAYRVLLVDDEHSLAALFCHFLEFAGHSCTAASSGAEALSLFSANPDGFDLLITDQSMPEMTGDQLIRAVHQLRPDLPVILASGFTDMLDDSEIESQHVLLLEKPFGRAEMLEAVNKALGS